MSSLLGLATCLGADVTWDGSESNDWWTGANWDNGAGPVVDRDYAYINSGEVLFESGLTANLSAVRISDAELTLAGGEIKATFLSGVTSRLDGTFRQTGGEFDVNVLEIAREAGDSGTYELSGGLLFIRREINGHSLYLGANRSFNDAGTGVFEISGGSLLTRAPVKLGDALEDGVGTFSVVGSAATEIGIANGDDDFDGGWLQSAGSSLKVGVDFGGLTPIFLHDSATDTSGTSATFESGSLLDVSFFNNGGGPGTWTVMEVENGDINDNGLAFAAGVDTGIWSFNVDNSGANGVLTVTSTEVIPHGDVYWDGSESNDWWTGSNWDNDRGPITERDYAYINAGEVLFDRGQTPNLSAVRIKDGELTVSGGEIDANRLSNVASHLDGTIRQSGGELDLNALEIAREPGDFGDFYLSGGLFNIGRAINGYSLFLGANRGSDDAGTGIFEISGGSFLTRTGIKLGDAIEDGAGTFAVLGSAIAQIGIGDSNDDFDGTWVQNAGSVLKVGVDFDGVTPIVLHDHGPDTSGTSAIFEAGALLDVDYFDGGYGGGTWTVMEVENGDIVDNGLVLAPGVDISVWSFSIDNSGANGYLRVTAVGNPGGIALNVGDTKRQQMRFGIDYERLWYWTNSMSAAEKDTVAKWSVVDCDVDYVRVAINSKYELEEGEFNLSAYTSKIIPMMQDMKDANPEIKFFASPRPLDEAYSDSTNVAWQPYPIWITGSPSLSSTSFNFQWQKCAEYLVRYIELMKSYGFKISFLDITNEWQSNVSGGRVTPSDVRDIAEYLKANLDPEDMPLIIAPSAWSYSQARSWMSGVNSTRKRNAIDIASAHNTDKTGTAQQFADRVNEVFPDKDIEIWNTELHGWKSTSGADEVLTSSFMFEAIRAGFSGINGWLAIGTTNQGHSYILNPSGNPSRNVKYFMFKKLSSTSNDGHALDVNQPGQFKSTAALIRGNLMTIWVVNESSDAVSVSLQTGRTISEDTIKATRWSEADSLPVEGVTQHLPASTDSAVGTVIEGESVYCFEILVDPVDQQFAKIEAEDFDQKSGMGTEACGDVGGTLNLSNINHGTWARYDGLTLGDEGVMRFRVARPSGRKDGWIEVRLDSPTGPLIGKAAVPETGDWQTYETIETTLEPVVGERSVYLSFVEVGSTAGSALFNLNWFSFTQSPAVEGLVASSMSASQIDLSWSASAGASSYAVKRSESSGGPYATVVTGLGTNNWSDMGLEPSTEFHYVVSADFSGGAGAESEEASAITRPDAPDAPVAQAVTASRIDLSWSAVPGATSYRVKRSFTEGGPYSTVAAGLGATSTSNTTGLTAGTRAYYVVSASNAGGEGADSAPSSAVPSDPIDPEDVVIASMGIFDSPGGGEEFSVSISQSGLGHLYQLQVSDDLSEDGWEDAGPVKPGNGGLLEIEFPIDENDGRKFYRVRVTRE